MFELHDRNLQAAICCYYDFEQPTVKLPCMALVRDATVGEGESISPSTKFFKTWKIQNTGMYKSKFHTSTFIGNQFGY